MNQCRICECSEDYACTSAEGEVCMWTDESRSLCNFCHDKWHLVRMAALHAVLGPASLQGAVLCA